MDSNNILLFLFAEIIGLIITYFIIKSAVASATKSVLIDSKRYLRLITRLKMRELKRQGADINEIHKLLFDEDETFYDTLRGMKTPEEQAAFDLEVEKIKAYQNQNR